MTTQPPSLQNVNAASGVLRSIVQSVQKVIVGRSEGVRLAVMGLAAGGHCLFEDVPGLAKTLLVRTLSQSAGLEFKRIQFTPDLLPADITGTYVYDLKNRSFRLQKGPVFSQILLADELNRAPPKTQAALLEAMQEHQVTLEGKVHDLPRPFHVYATQNPIESEGVYVLPEAELDRFMLRVSMGYPTPKEELEVLNRVESWDGEFPQVARVATPQDLERTQAVARAVFVHPDIKDYVVRLVHATRHDGRVLVGSSPRGGIALMKLAKAAAVLAGREFATADDVKQVAHAAIDHRMLVRPEAAARGFLAHHVVADLLKTLRTPAVPKVARA